MPATMGSTSICRLGFNEAAGADPADACRHLSMNSTGSRCFNEAAGADPADARASLSESSRHLRCFNEAAGADPADASEIRDHVLQIHLLQ